MATKEERRAARKARKVEAALVAGGQQDMFEGNPLSRQVGGSHYQTKIQHVEFCQGNRMPWCESAAIKYIVRHRSKNGKQDIAKAIHYLELLQALDYGRREEVPQDMDPKKFQISLEDFLKGNDIPEPEAQCIRNICSHQVGGGDGGTNGLIETVRILRRIHDNYQQQEDLNLL